MNLPGNPARVLMGCEHCPKNGEERIVAGNTAEEVARNITTVVSKQDTEITCQHCGAVWGKQAISLAMIRDEKGKPSWHCLYTYEPRSPTAITVLDMLVVPSENEE